jgi:hypothetical protein
MQLPQIKSETLHVFFLGFRGMHQARLVTSTGENRLAVRQAVPDCRRLIHYLAGNVLRLLAGLDQEVLGAAGGFGGCRSCVLNRSACHQTGFNLHRSPGFLSTPPAAVRIKYIAHSSAVGPAGGRQRRRLGKGLRRNGRWPLGNLLHAKSLVSPIITLVLALRKLASSSNSSARFHQPT